MRELSLNEVEYVNGGHPFLWMVGGYLFGEAVDAVRKADWGEADEDEMTIAP
ncbi:MAG: hypothetical protein ACPGTQ_14895 [Colwellia sp.]